MNHDDLNAWSKRAADWTRDYHASLRDRPVRARTTPGATRAQLPASPPETAEPMEDIFADFEAIVPDAMTHWQHPRFFAYFPANAAPASMLAEQLANAMASNCMIWQGSPAATEIEEQMIQWLAQAVGLSGVTGTIHDSATTATLAAILAMREAATGHQGNTTGLSVQPRLRLYASAQAHSSVDKGARVAGIGQENLVKVPTRPDFGLDPKALDGLIRNDIAAGYRPAGVILCVGGTSIGATDPIAQAIAVAKSHDLPVHVDAAWAGSAMICPELRPLWQGIDRADSIVFNPHKWMGAQFDCSVQLLRDPTDQLRALTLKPEYLQTQGAPTTDFNDWTVPLGRRFRALKLWFVLRAYGLDGLRARIRNHIAWAEALAARIADMPGFEITTPPSFSLFTFAFRDDTQTESLFERINADGRIYLTQTRHEGRYVIRVQVGQFDCTEEDVRMIDQVLKDLT